jgi:hypothetical protein
MVKNAKVQEGDTPAEDPNALLAEYNRITEQVVALVQRINRTNSSTPIEGHNTIADAIAERDGLRIRAATYRELADAGTVTQSTYTRSEIKFRSAVSVANLQKQADELAQRHRELDAALQAMNWATELAE